METCLTITGILLVLAVIVVIVVVARATTPPKSPSRRRGRFESCPACEAELFAGDRACPDCGLELSGKLAARLDRLRIARREIRYLKEDGLLDEETAYRVSEQLAKRKYGLLHPKERPEDRHVPPPLPAEARSPPAEPRLPDKAPNILPAEPVVAMEHPPPEPPPPRRPRRSLAEVFGQFMHERNILWGELAGGLLIVGCSIALVLSLWRTLETLPYFTFLLAAGITGVVFGAGYYTLHHWNLKSTSRGLLVIALLLTPLNLLLLADLGTRGTTDAIDIAVKIVAVLAFAGLVRTGGRDLVGVDALPGLIPRRWLLALAVVGAPASQMVPAVWQLPVWLPLGCFAVAGGATIRRLNRDQKRADSPPLDERAATAVLVFIGLGLFALFAAWGFLLSRADQLAEALRFLAVPAVVAGMPVLAAGLLVQRRLAEPAGLRATGTGVALAGMMVLYAGLVLAWPDPLALLVTAAAIALVLGRVAFRDELPWMYAGAIPCAALAAVLLFAGHAPEGVDPSRWLAERVTTAHSGAVLAVLACALLASSEFLWRIKRAADARAVALGAAGVAVVSLLLATVHGLDRPYWAVSTYLACAVGFTAASFRWHYRVVAQAGIWLLVPATLWGLWATVPHQRDVWGTVLAAESLALALAAVGLHRLALLRIACRDVAGATAILAPVLALFSADVPHEWTHTLTLFLIAATAFVLAGLYRAQALAWIGSLVAFVGFLHLGIYALELTPWRSVVLLALLVHATIATAAAMLLGRAEHRQVPDAEHRQVPDAEHRQVPDVDNNERTEAAGIGHLTVLRSPELFANPLRYSARLTSCLAVPLLFFPIPALAGTWAVLTVWTAVIWLAMAIAWRERGSFALFQGAMTWAAALVGLAWVKEQGWFPGRFGVIEPRALQAYGVAIGILSVGWEIAQRTLRRFDDVRRLWAEFTPSVDRVVLGGLVIGQLMLAAGGLLPAVAQELTPRGAAPLYVPAAEASHVWSSGAWLLLAILTAALGLALRWPERMRADAGVVGAVLLALTAPFLLAGLFAPELAAASALRWGLAGVFLVGSVCLVVRDDIGHEFAKLGFRSRLSPWGPATLRGLLAVAAGVVIVLTSVVAMEGFAGQVPTGPAAGSAFHDMGWTASVMTPLVALVVGLGATSLRERSSGYAFVAGWILMAAVAGGYALGVVTSGASLTPPELVRITLLAIGAVAVWSLAWQAVERRVPGDGLLTVDIVLSFAGLITLCAVPLGHLMANPGRPLGDVSARLGLEGWLALVPAAIAAIWHARKLPTWRFHAIGLALALAGVLLACAVQRWDQPGLWRSMHVLAGAWAVAGIGLATLAVRSREGDVPPALRVWPELFAVGLAVFAVRGGWTDPWRPWGPAGAVAVAGLLFGTVAWRTHSRVNEYVTGMLAMLVGFLIWIVFGPATLTGLAMAVAIGLALAGVAWALIGYRRAERRERPDVDTIGPLTRLRSPEALPEFAHAAVILSLGLLLFGIVPTLYGAHVDPRLLPWGLVASVGVGLALLLRDRQARFAAGGLYVLGVAVIGLGIANTLGGPVWLDWVTPVALATYVVGASGVAVASRSGFRRKESGHVHEWFVIAQGIVGALVLGMAVRTAVSEANAIHRLMSPLSGILLIPAAALLVRISSLRSAVLMRSATLLVGAAAAGLLAWAIPDPLGSVPWLTRHAGLFLALSVVAAAYLGRDAFRTALPFPPPGFAGGGQGGGHTLAGREDSVPTQQAVTPHPALPPQSRGEGMAGLGRSRDTRGWAADFRRIGGAVGVSAVVVLGVVLVQQIPVFDPATKKTPLDPVAVGGVIVGILLLMALALRGALRPEHDPLGPTPQGRTGYVYLAEVLLVLLFAHVRLNIPEVFNPEAVRYWTFVVMLLAFIGVGLAELFAHRGLRVLSRPLMRTGVLLPLIPLVAFWARLPEPVARFAEDRAPGLVPMIGYLRHLPQHFDTYALLWFLAGLLYGLIALSRRSFGWALLGALATNAGIWALLAHHEVPAAVHPQAWAIPLALIVLVSEHVNRRRLRAEVAAGLRYLGISMIYIASSADLFIAGVGQSWWLPIVLAVLCLGGVVAGVLVRVRAFLYLGIGFLLLDVFAMIWHAAVDRQQTWVWYASGMVLGALIIALFAVLEKRRNDVRELVGRLRQWNS